MDPCMYGICRVQEMETFYRKINRLECECREQYTGKFCDSKWLEVFQFLNWTVSVRVSGFWILELLMYSPIGGHFLFMGLFFLFFMFWTQRSSAARITIVDDVPDFSNYEPDIDLLYPASMDEIDSEAIRRQKDTYLEWNLMTKSWKIIKCLFSKSL